MRLASLLLSAVLAASAAHAGGYRTVEWADLQAEIYGDREVLPAGAALTITAPVRATDDRRVPVEIAAETVDGSLIRSVSLIIDENPMPVSAVFEFERPHRAFRVAADMRLNGPTPVRAVIETVDGRLMMAETFVKTSGLGACAAPPVGDPEQAIASIGEMQAVEQSPIVRLGAEPRTVRLEMSHPQHTGMQMDQITLHYILARYIEEVDVWAGDEKLFHLTGSISLSEDPAITFEVPDAGAESLRVRFKDTDAEFERVLPLGHQG